VRAFAGKDLCSGLAGIVEPRTFFGCHIYL
jgi:hypothetical protein